MNTLPVALIPDIAGSPALAITKIKGITP